MAIYDTGVPDELMTGMRLARGAIARGELVVIPTDTVYGVAADAFSPAAVQRLLAASATEPDITRYAAQVSAILALVQAGFGAALVPPRRYALENVVVRDLDTAGVPDELSGIAVCVAWREDGVNPVVPRVLEMLD